MKISIFALSACALCASVAMAAPKAPVAKAKVAPVKVAAKAPTKVAVKTPAKPAVQAPTKVAPTKVAQADASDLKPEQMPGFFPDVPRDHWAFAAVQRLAAAGIVNGYPATQTPKPAQVAAAPTAVAAQIAKNDAQPERMAALPAPVEDAKSEDAKSEDAKSEDAKSE